MNRLTRGKALAALMLAALAAMEIAAGCAHPPGEDQDEVHMLVMDSARRNEYLGPDTAGQVEQLVTGFDSLVKGLEENARLVEKVDSLVKDREARKRRYWRHD